MKKNERIMGICCGYTKDGHGVVKVDGFPLFVKGMLEGEEGELVVTLMKKSYGYARLLSLIKSSPMRKTPLCPAAKSCGGCQLQHMAYEEQLRFKKQMVQDVLRRIGKVEAEVRDVLGASSQWHYRNKGQIPVGTSNQKVVTGFYRIHSNEIIDMDSCCIQSERINEVLQVMKELLRKYGNGEFFRHLLIKDGFHSGEVMVVWIVRERSFPYCEEMVQELVKRLSYIQSVILNLNTRTDNVILGEQEELLYGREYITDRIYALSFRISSKSFYQVNPIQTEVLYGTALEFCALKGKETVLDLYCGVGTISMFLAQRAKKVVGIEIVAQAIKQAKENALRNQISNVEFICSDAAAYAERVSREGLHPDVIVVDPPRKGCDRLTLDSMIAMAPERIVYVSCDPATMARDAGILEQAGYRVELVQPVDMFPNSYHVECVMLIVKEKKCEKHDN